MTRSNSNLVKSAIEAIAPPSASEPVSPMNTLAGWALKTRKPSTAPTTATEKIATSYCD